VSKRKLIGIISIIIGASLITEKMVHYGVVYTPRFFLDVFDHGLYGFILIVVGLVLLDGFRRHGTNE
jgi:hypothetical protein